MGIRLRVAGLLEILIGSGYRPSRSAEPSRENPEHYAPARYLHWSNCNAAYHPAQGTLSEDRWLACLDAFRTFCCSDEARLGAERASELLAA